MERDKHQQLLAIFANISNSATDLLKVAREYHELVNVRDQILFQGAAPSEATMNQPSVQTVVMKSGGASAWMQQYTDKRAELKKRIGSIRREVAQGEDEEVLEATVDMAKDGWMALHRWQQNVESLKRDVQIWLDQRFGWEDILEEMEEKYRGAEIFAKRLTSAYYASEDMGIEPEVAMVVDSEDAIMAVKEVPWTEMVWVSADVADACRGMEAGSPLV